MSELNQNAISPQLKEPYSSDQFALQTGDCKGSYDKIGRYIILKELGRGSMGKVYLAHDPFIDRQVAIKTALFTSNSIMGIEEIQQRFFNEARATGRLMHPHIVTLYDALIEGDTYYLIMEHVEGMTLKEYCQERTVLPLEEAVSIIFQCAKALDYAHNTGIIHRDIKPKNILITENVEVKISDFSIAVVEGLSTSDSFGSFTGSVFYTPPELLQEKPLTPQSDLFSLGVVMYEILTGTKPFSGDTEVAVFYQILNKSPEPLRKYRRDIPESLEHIVSRMLEKDPTRRYQRGSEIAAELSETYDKIRHTDEKIDFQEKFNALKKLNFFKDFTQTEINEVLRVTQWLQCEADSVIVTEGEIDECFYIIVLGEVSVSKGNKNLAVLKQGDCFGEMAILSKTKRTANIKALSKAVLMKINASIMEETSLNTQNRFFKVFSKTLIQRLAYANQMLSNNFL